MGLLQKYIFIGFTLSFSSCSNNELEEPAWVTKATSITTKERTIEVIDSLSVDSSSFLSLIYLDSNYFLDPLAFSTGCGGVIYDRYLYWPPCNNIDYWPKPNINYNFEIVNKSLKLADTSTNNSLIQENNISEALIDSLPIILSNKTKRREKKAIKKIERQNRKKAHKVLNQSKKKKFNLMFWKKSIKKEKNSLN